MDDGSSSSYNNSSSKLNDSSLQIFNLNDSSEFNSSSNSQRQSSININESTSSSNVAIFGYDQIKHKKNRKRDWNHDFAKDRNRKNKVKKRKTLKGMVTGLLAAFIAISSDWISDIKEGHCKSGFYLNRKFCCWGNPGYQCPDWEKWSDFFDIRSSFLKKIINFGMYTFIACLTTFIAAYLVREYAPYSAGSGIPEVKTILGGFVIKDFLGIHTLIMKCIGLSLSVGAGLSVGKEGPLVHVGCCVGNLCSRLFSKFNSNSARRREALSAASAAGVSVAFGAPIGGVLFSLEEVSYYFPMKTLWRSFLSALVGALTLQLMNPFRSGKVVLFQVAYTRIWHIFELPVYILLGVIGGLYGAFFIKMNMKVVRLRKFSWLKKYPIQEVFVVTLITSILSYGFLFLRVSMTQLISNLFRECSELESDFGGLCKKSQLKSTIFMLLVALVLKIIMTIFTFGIRVPAGIFVPSLAVGALIGRIIGILMQLWQESHPDLWLFASCNPDVQCVTPGVYAFIGAAAALGGVTRMTVSTTVIMFELTGSLSYVLPVMVTVMVSKWVGDAFDRDSIYDALIDLNQYPFLDSKRDYYSDAVVSDIMTKEDNIIALPAIGLTLNDIENILQEYQYQGFPIVNNTYDKLLIGYIGRSELRYTIDQASDIENVDGQVQCYFTKKSPDAYGIGDPTKPQRYLDLRPWIDATPYTITPNYKVVKVLEIFKKIGLRHVIIVKRGKLVGILNKKDLLRYLSTLKDN
ncbi:hypothetical protein PIROE2DRAFT_68547 [Piromyces sp. E2]|nr:hypothetical protein PIROE2DRAFT_68547 [Piromyces sp. E2]|eukprot:OUM69369.1 hypothetical protein PIROE2DRAFT_68547 [Piromyces sp. E2]